MGCGVVVFYLGGDGSGRIQSLLLAVALMIIGAQTVFMGLQADMIAQNRKLLEDIQYRVAQGGLRAAGRAGPAAGHGQQRPRRPAGRKMSKGRKRWYENYGCRNRLCRFVRLRCCLAPHHNG